MDTEKIKLVTEQFALAVRNAYGNSLRDVILYGSCARGDFEKDSDIDIMVLLDIPQDYAKYRLEKSKEDLSAAHLLFNNGIYQKNIRKSSALFHNAEDLFI